MTEENDVQVDRTGNTLQISVRGTLAMQILDMIQLVRAVEYAGMKPGQAYVPTAVAPRVVRGILEQGLVRFHMVYCPMPRGWKLKPTEEELQNDPGGDRPICPGEGSRNPLALGTQPKTKG
jgi:hypothetical protein